MTRTIIFSFLIFVVPTAVQTLEEPLMTFDNRNSVCYGPGTHGHFRPSCYDENSLMAIRNLKAGAKPLAKGCPGSVTKWTNHSGSYLVDHMDTSKILDESACCIPDYSQDCIFDFNYANSGLSYFYHVSCSGYSECKPNMDVSWQLTSCNNSSIYPSGTNYMFMEYSCINRTKIVNMCSNKSHTASSGTVYLTTPNYPESVKPDIDACKCHIQTNGTKLSFYSIDMRLNKFGNDCKQSLNVTDSDGTTVWDCESAPKFNITEVTFNSQMTVTFYNNLMVDGGQAWIGFSGGEGNIVTINCQNEQTSDSTTPFQRTSSTDNITTTSFSRTETTVSPTSEPTSLSGRKNESQSPISNEQMSTSSMTNPSENGFTESTIKDQNGWSSTTAKRQNALTDSTIKDGNDLTVSTSKDQNGLTESKRIDNTFSGERFTTTKTQSNSFQHTINVENNDLTWIYVLLGFIAFICLLVLMVKIVKHACCETQVRPASNNVRNAREEISMGRAFEQQGSPTNNTRDQIRPVISARLTPKCLQERAESQSDESILPRTSSENSDDVRSKSCPSKEGKRSRKNRRKMKNGSNTNHTPESHQHHNFYHIDETVSSLGNNDPFLTKEKTNKGACVMFDKPGNNERLRSSSSEDSRFLDVLSPPPSSENEERIETLAKEAKGQHQDLSDKKENDNLLVNESDHENDASNENVYDENGEMSTTKSRRGKRKHRMLELQGTDKMNNLNLSQQDMVPTTSTTAGPRFDTFVDNDNRKGDKQIKQKKKHKGKKKMKKYEHRK